MVSDTRGGVTYLIQNLEVTHWHHCKEQSNLSSSLTGCIVAQIHNKNA